MRKITDGYILSPKMRYFLGWIIFKMGLRPKEIPFSGWRQEYIRIKYGQDKSIYWEKFGDDILNRMDTEIYRKSADHQYIDKIIEYAQKKTDNTIIELGGGFFRNIKILQKQLPNHNFYNIDFAIGVDEKFKELKSDTIHFIKSDVLEIKNYKHVLKNIVFTYGLFMYLNQDNTENYLADLKKYAAPNTFFIILEPGQAEINSEKIHCDKLEKTFARKGGTYIHNYPALFKQAGFTEIETIFSKKTINILYIAKS